MKKVNLRDLYPDVYKNDYFVEVTEDVLETIRAAERAEAAYDRRMYRYKAYYSLDCDNGIENAILMKPQTPEMLLEEKQLREQLYAAVMALPEKQAKRIYARYYLGMRVSEIATAEGVDQSRVRDSIRRGLKQLAKYFRIELQMGRKVSKCFWHRALRPICTLVFFEQRKYNKSYWRKTMMDYMTLKEASEKWGVTPRQINYLCASGRIPGAVKMAGVWLIPKTAEKPVDGRTKQGKVQKA